MYLTNLERWWHGSDIVWPGSESDVVGNFLAVLTGLAIVYDYESRWHWH